MAKLRLLGCLGVLICLTVACRASVYMVGDSSGWDISTDLDSWVRGKRFVIGDVLVFQYSSGDSVCELTKQEFEGCNTTNALLSTSGNSTFSLTKPGDRYFASGNRLHCLGGMKLQVHVQPNSTTPSPLGAPEPAPGPATASSLPRTSKTNNPALTSSAQFFSVSHPFLLFMLGYVGYLILGTAI